MVLSNTTFSSVVTEDDTFAEQKATFIVAVRSANESLSD